VLSLAAFDAVFSNPVTKRVGLYTCYRCKIRTRRDEISNTEILRHTVTTETDLRTYTLLHACFVQNLTSPMHKIYSGLLEIVGDCRELISYRRRGQDKTV